jgi:hypothetical protein
VRFDHLFVQSCCLFGMHGSFAFVPWTRGAPSYQLTVYGTSRSSSQLARSAIVGPRVSSKSILGLSVWPARMERKLRDDATAAGRASSLLTSSPLEGV